MRKSHFLWCLGILLAALAVAQSGVGVGAQTPAGGGGAGRGAAAAPAAASKAPAVPGANWTTYGADLASTHYSPLDQITRDNFSKLQLAWKLNTNNLGPRPDNLFSSLPLVIDGVMYATAGSRRTVIALNAATGEMVWIHSEDEGQRGQSAPRSGAGRGLSYWTSADGADQRIIYVTPGYRMVALNAKTGAPIATFGKAGVVDLKLEDDQVIDLVTGEVGLNATPLIAGDVVVVGAAHRAAGSPRLTQSVKGFVRGFDVKTGKRLWIFHTIPMKGEFGYDTWENGSAEKNFNLGAWAQMSADLELGLLYVPLEMPAADYYGAHRPGNGLFAESLVALDLKTGNRKWHYQTVHHGVWDWDLPCAPILFNMTQNGRTVKALAQPTKSAFLFVLNRETGEPVWPIEERPVPQSNVPGEKTSPTQPFPTKPKPFDRQGVSEDDLIDLTPSMKADALEYIKTRRIGPIFTPPSLATPGGPVATLMLPADVGGANWPGGSFDPETSRLYIHSHTSVFNLNNIPADLSQAGPSAPEPGEGPVPGARGGAAPGAAGAGAAAPGARGAGGGGGRGAGGFGGRGAGAPGGPGAAGPGLPGGPGGAGAFGARAGGAGGGRGGGPIQGMPLVKPPYDRITAYDMNTGDMIWQKAHSSSSDAMRNNAALKGVDLKGLDINRLGATGRIFIGTLVTKNMVIAGDGGGVHTEPSGERVAFLRAYDKATGADLGTVSMPGHQTGGPMTYMANGKQYITVSISDAAAGGSAFVTYALP